MADPKPNLPPAFSGSAAQTKPEGWWSLPSHIFDGSRAGVLKAVLETNVVPDEEDKRYIAYRIGKLPAECNYVTVDAHVCHDDLAKWKEKNHFSWKADFQVAGSIRL